MSDAFSRRDFLIATLASGSLWAFGGSISMAQIPWEGDQKETFPIEEDARLQLGSRKQVGEGRRTESPRIALLNDRVYLLWLSADFEKETLHLAEFDGTTFVNERVLVADERIMHPCLFADKKTGRLYACWSQESGDGWELRFAEKLESNGADVYTISDPTAAINWRSKISVLGGSPVVVWERKREDSLEVVFRVKTSGGDWSDLQAVSDSSNDCCRPAVAIGADGELWVSWDQADTVGGSSIQLCSLDKGLKRSSIKPVTDHPAMNHSPALTVDRDGAVWIAWHSNRRGKDEWDIPRWIEARCYKDGEFHDPVSSMQDKNLEKEGTDQSFEFANIYACPNGGVIVTGRASHNFCFQVLGKDGWSRLYRIPAEGWGGRGQYLLGEFDSAGGFWIVRRDLNANLLHRIEGLEALQGTPEIEARSIAATPVAISNIQKAPRWAALEELEGIDEPLLPFFGDIHGHTWMSDGVGDVDEYFRIRREYYEDDFCSLTDHDTFVGNSIFPSEFEFQKELTDHYHEDGKFVTLFGQEYTTGRPPRGIGHKCLYDIRKDVPLYQHLDKRYNSTAKINPLLRERGAIWAPHHTGWVGTDWDAAEDDVQPFVEICSNHGRFEFMGNRPLPHRGGMRGAFVQDALAKGHKIGIVGGSDSHGLIWHHGVGWKRDCHRTGLAVVLAPELTREAIFDAMKKRRVYGTTGIKPLLDFRIDNHVMGSEISVTEPKVSIKVHVAAQQGLKWLTIVKDNKDFYEFGGEGWESRFTLTDEDLTPGTHWYYLRVEFDGKEMAWSSPIWVTYG